MITTTFNKAKEAGACRNCYRGMKKALGGINKSYGRDTPIPVSAILDTLGMNDALWALAHTCGRKGVKLCHTFACDVAEHVLPAWQKEHPKDNRPAEAIRIKRLWIEGKATDGELAVARNDVDSAEGARAAWWAAVATVGAGAAAAAAGAAGAAWWAAQDAWAAGTEERAWQEQHLRELLEMSRDIHQMYADAERPARRKKLIRDFLGLALLALGFIALSFVFGDALP